MARPLREIWRIFMAANDRAIEMAPADVRAASRLRLREKAPDTGSVAPSLEPWTLPALRPGQVLIKISAAGVNPSDVKAAIGLMPHAVFPRTPGRDFSGVVVEGPQNLVGREVFGSSGDLGIRMDG